MVAPKDSPSTPNSGRATVRDVLNAVVAMNDRIDGVNERVDTVVTGQQQLSVQMTKLHSSMHDLKQATNERLHEMEADIAMIMRPWRILASGWSRAVALAGFAGALTGLVAKLQLWHLLPF